jgi:hypothetical protein
MKITKIMINIIGAAKIRNDISHPPFI